MRWAIVAYVIWVDIQWDGGCIPKGNIRYGCWNPGGLADVDDACEGTKDAAYYWGSESERKGKEEGQGSAERTVPK